MNNVRDAAQRFHLPWPVLADQKGSTWKAYDSQGWPDRFLVDPQGKIVMSVFGEGNNLVMEKKIQELLAVAHPEVLKIPLESDEDEFRAGVRRCRPRKPTSANAMDAAHCQHERPSRRRGGGLHAAAFARRTAA